MMKTNTTVKRYYIAIATLILQAILIGSVNAQDECVQCGNNHNDGDYSTTLGEFITSSGFVSFASGYQVYSTNDFSYAHGKFLNASGTNSIILGSYANAIQHHSMVFGHGANNSNRLENNIDYSLMIGFNSDLPTFFVGKSLGEGYTGRIGIGNVTSPQAKLHIREDENVDEPGVFIQGFNEEQPAYLWLGTKSYGVRRVSGTLEFLTGDYYEFNDGNVGIGISEPREKLEVDGNVKVVDRYRLETTQVRSSSREGLKLFTSMGAGIFIDERGQVGIGNTRPGATLDVTGKIKTYSLQIPGTNPIDSLRDITNYVLKSKDDYGNVIWAPQSSLDDGDWSTTQTGDLYFNAGKVGIGTDDPVEKFQIGDRWTFHNGGGPKIIGYNFFWDGGAKRIVQDYVSIIKLDSEGDIEFKTAAQGGGGTPIEEWTDVLTLKNNGKVGIGTSSPDEKLHVAGNIKTEGLEASGNIQAANITATTNITAGSTLQAGSIVTPGSLTAGSIATSGAITSGKLQTTEFTLTGNGAGAGKFLKSDGTGKASWEHIPAAGDEDWEMSDNNVHRLNGNVGIGTTNPEYRLQVSGGDDYVMCHFNKGSNALNIGSAFSDGSLNVWGSTYLGFNVYRQGDNLWHVGKGGSPSNGGAMIFGSVGGTLLFTTIPKNGEDTIQQMTNEQIRSYTQMRLTPDGLLETNEVKVDADLWSDFVFHADYELPDLTEVESFINKNKHLPDIPSEAQVKEEGINLGQMDALLLQKIEELTLYVIDLKKENQVMRQRIDELEK